MTTPLAAGLPDHATWVFAGDSITHGVFHTHGERSWVELVHEQIRWELDRLTDIVVNSGVSGWSAPQVMSAFDHLIGRFQPNVVSISLGTNDSLQGDGGLSVFVDGLGELVRRSAAVGGAVVLHTPALVMPDAPDSRRQFLSDYAEVVRSVAASSHALLVDHERHWRDHFGDQAPTAWMDDHTHPNAEGHRQMADLTVRELGLGSLGARP